MKSIPLRNGGVALIDNEDFDTVSKYRWYKDTRTGYAIMRADINGNSRSVSMHRLIMQPNSFEEIDHRKPGSGLDNRRENLRRCTHSQNQYNRGPQKNNTSGFKGVSWSKKSKKWMASIRANKKHFILGYFTDKLQAAAAYASAARDLHGEFARTA